jgi:hypothetical protein
LNLFVRLPSAEHGYVVPDSAEVAVFQQVTAPAPPHRWPNVVARLLAVLLLVEGGVFTALAVFDETQRNTMAGVAAYTGVLAAQVWGRAARQPAMAKWPAVVRYVLGGIAAFMPLTTLLWHDTTWATIAFVLGIGTAMAAEAGGQWLDWRAAQKERRRPQQVLGPVPPKWARRRPLLDATCLLLLVAVVLGRVLLGDRRR